MCAVADKLADVRAAHLDDSRVNIRSTEAKQTRANAIDGYVVVVLTVEVSHFAALGFGEICRPLTRGELGGPFAQKLCPRGNALLGMFVQFLCDAVVGCLILQDTPPASELSCATVYSRLLLCLIISCVYILNSLNRPRR